MEEIEIPLWVFEELQKYPQVPDLPDEGDDDL
jgi:hypothetical protein